MKQRLKLLIAGVVVIFLLIYIIKSFRNSSPPPQVAEPPALAETPVVVYGVVEPAGREVFVSPPMTKRVMEIYVAEGDAVKAGQRLCTLENSVEQEQVNLAQARVGLAQKSLELSIDEMNRAASLFKNRVDTEYKYTQARLQQELETRRLKVANNELDVAKAQFEQTILRAPVDGRVYKFDVRLGETLAAGDNQRIILGSAELQARLFVEGFWKDRVKAGMGCVVYDSETRAKLGTGIVRSQSPYMGRRDFRTEDAQERFDTKFQEVVIALAPERQNIPLGLSVMAEFK